MLIPRDENATLSIEFFQKKCVRKINLKSLFS